MKKLYSLISLALTVSIAAAQSWKPAASMNYIRAGHILVTLADGTILSAGGWDPTTGVNHQNAEVYDPVQDKWTPVGDMSSTRYGAKAVLLNNGKVLIAGGYNKACNCDLKTAELYDPVAKTFSLTDSMSTVRYAHTITLLKDGRVLVAGGTDGVCSCFLESAETYDPVQGKWNDAGVMSQDREFHTATLLDDGRVLITGGNNWNDFQVNTTDIFEPSNDSWTTGPVMFYKRDNHAAVKLADGRVLVTGGRRFEYATTTPSYEAHYSSIYEAEIMDAAGTGWTLGSNPMLPGMSYHRMILLNDGSVLSIAGTDSSTSKFTTTASVTQRFIPAGETWSPAAMSSDARFEFEAVKMKDGSVMVCGGNASTCEIYATVSGLGDQNQDGLLSFYPNPVQGTLYLSLPGAGDASVTIINALGEIVYSKQMSIGNTMADVSALVPGVYFLKTESDGNIRIGKFLKASE